MKRTNEKLLCNPNCFRIFKDCSSSSTPASWVQMPLQRNSCCCQPCSVATGIAGTTKRALWIFLVPGCSLKHTTGAFLKDAHKLAFLKGNSPYFLKKREADVHFLRKHRYHAWTLWLWQKLDSPLFTQGCCKVVLLVFKGFQEPLNREQWSYKTVSHSPLLKIPHNPKTLPPRTLSPQDPFTLSPLHPFTQDAKTL